MPRNKNNLAFKFIDLFSGCGGLSLGLINAGWKGLFAIEKNADAFKTLKHNLIDSTKNPCFSWPSWFEERPIKIQEFIKVYKKQLKQLRGKVNLIAGGPPCQGFSLAGRRTGKDPRNQLFKYQLQIVDIIRPELVLLENVHGIEMAFGSRKKKTKNIRNSKKSYAERIYKSLEKHCYNVQQETIKAVDFGVPQLRPRCFIIGIRRDILKKKEIPKIKELLFASRENFLSTRGLPIDHPVTVSDAISDLITAGRKLVDCDDKDSPAGFKEITYEGPETTYQKLMHGNLNGTKPNSLRLVNHHAKTIQRFIEILNTCRKGSQLSNDDKLRFGIKKNTFTPLDPNKPSHTLTTLPDDLLHYSEPRVHTVREHARLQSFPDWFEFKGKYTTGGQRRKKDCPRYTQVGNAVPPLLSEAIGEILLQVLKLENQH